MYCTNCGNKINKNEKYCTNCGQICNKKNEENIDKTLTEPTVENDNIPTILGIIACVFFWIPLISIPLAVTSIIIGINQKKITNKTSTGTILGIVSLILTTVAIITIILLLRFAAIHVNEIIDDFQKENIIDNDIFNKYYNKYNKENDIKGYNWSINDSILYLNPDLTYIWYEDANNEEDNYEKGEFKTFKGENAIDYIANTLKEFGITEEEQEKKFKNKLNDLNDYYLLILTSKEIKKKGTDSQKISNTKYYYGIYNEEEKTIEFINMFTREKTIFIRKEKLSSIDV